jgi:hypothetical protein
MSQLLTQPASHAPVSKSCCFLFTTAILFSSECLVLLCVQPVNFSQAASLTDQLSHFSSTRCVEFMVDREKENYLYLIFQTLKLYSSCYVLRVEEAIQ